MKAEPSRSGQMRSKALIHLERRPAWSDRWQAYHVFIDAKDVGPIRQRESHDYEVQPGQHTVRLRIAWGSSPSLSLDVAAGSTRKLVCKSHPHFLTVVYFITFGRHRYIELYQEA